jgi:hypothetical protein
LTSAIIAMDTTAGSSMMVTSENGMILLRAVRPRPKIPRRLCTVSARTVWPRPRRGPS